MPIMILCFCANVDGGIVYDADGFSTVGAAARSETPLQCDEEGSAIRRPLQGRM